MRTRLVFPLVSAALLAVPLGGVAMHAANISLGPVTVTQNLLPGLAAATDLGAADPATSMRLVLSVGRPQPAGEQALLDAEHDPSSASYGHYLSPAEFASRFGVARSQLDAVTSWLSGGGLSVDSASAARDIIAVRGTVAQVSARFSTPIHRFSYAGVTFVANTAAPVVPLSLGIANVIGLNTLQRYSTPAGEQQDTCLTDATCVGLTTPTDLWGVYQQPAAYQGQGQSIAIFGEGQSDGVVSDLRAYEAQNGLPQIPVTVRHPAGDTDFSDDAGHIEWNIDTQASTGMAPEAVNLTLYFGQDLSDADVTKVMSQWTDDQQGPMQASASYGECETIPVVSPIAGQPLLNPVLPVGQGLGNNVDATETQIMRQAAIEGKTLFASTGDTGSSCPVAYAAVIGAGNGVLNQGAPITNSPASLPYVVGVGGTVLYTDGQGHRNREYGWNYSGGGSTLFTPAPSYQQETPGLSYPCVTDPGSICRGIADVSAQSGDVLTNGYAIISSGQPSVGGGTSLSSPLWEGMWVRVQSGSPLAEGNGFANYALYRVGQHTGSYTRDFFDITSTDPATGLPSTNGAYPTLPGWDYVTGFGAPKVDGLICDIDGKNC
jgi:pseudomonalisin